MAKKKTIKARNMAQEIEDLSRDNERHDILNRILRYLIKNHQTFLTYKEIEEITLKETKR